MWNLTKSRSISARQNLAVQILSWSPIMEAGAPKVDIHPKKKQDAIFLAVSFWTVGISLVKPDRRQVQLKIML